jgi:hypothetical protein
MFLGNIVPFLMGHSAHVCNAWFQDGAKAKYSRHCVGIVEGNILKWAVLKREYLLSFSSEYFSSHVISKNIKIKIYKTVILPVLLRGCETWSLILREEIIGGWRKLHNKELHNLCASPVLPRIITIKSRFRWGM